MKNKFFLIIICLFTFIGTVNAAINIDDISISISINEDGSADIVENWTISDNNIKYIDKTFFGLDNVKVSDISVSNSDCSVYTEVKTLGKKGCEYQYLKNKLSIYSKNPGVYSISYKIDKFITEFKDLNGINYFLFVGDNQSVSKFSSTIVNPYGFNPNNSALYIISNSNVSANYIEDHVEIVGSNISKNSKIRFMSTLVDVSFTNKVKNKKKFMDVYHSAMNNYLIIEKVKSLVKNRLFVFGVSGAILLIIYLILNKIMGGNKNDDYFGFVSYNKVRKFNLENISYYDSIPCNGDLYKIFFIAGYYGLIKNKSDLIGAYLLKWDLEGIVKVNYKEEESNITLYGGDDFSRALDQDLFAILRDASNDNVIESNRFIKYANSHYLRVITWFNMGFNETINMLINSGDIKRKVYFKKMNLVVDEGMYNDGVLISGVKKYLLNFNQVPRQTELTQQNYKYLLILAELLGIGKQVAEEILRKNPDNYMASELMNLENSKFLFKKVFETANTPYKEVVKNKKIKSSYDPEMERLLKQRNQEEEVKSKL